MKYFVTVVQNGTTPATFSYDTLDEALAYYHQELAYRGEGRTATLCFIFDSVGSFYRNENWEEASE